MTDTVDRATGRTTVNGRTGEYAERSTPKPPVWSAMLGLLSLAPRYLAIERERLAARAEAAAKTGSMVGFGAVALLALVGSGVVLIVISARNGLVAASVAPWLASLIVGFAALGLPLLVLRIAFAVRARRRLRRLRSSHPSSLLAHHDELARRSAVHGHDLERRTATIMESFGPIRSLLAIAGLSAVIGGVATHIGAKKKRRRRG